MGLAGHVDGISRSRGWDKEIPHCVLPMEQLVLSDKWARNIFLANRIRISEILPWDRKSYLTHAILPRLSRECFTHWLYWNSHTWSSSDVIVVKVTSSCEIAS